jgi:hypothetical protein
MTTPIASDPIYRRRRFDAEIIEVCVRWTSTTAELSRFGGHHGGARRYRVAHDDPTVVIRPCASDPEVGIAGVGLCSSMRRRAARSAREVARKHGTPIYVWEDGKVVPKKS